MEKIKTGKQMSFETIADSYQLIDYLDAKARLNSSKYLYQYTTVNALVNMIRSKTLHLANAKNMNDQLEYQNGDPKVWNDLFFSCFMMEDDESIGMWSMYAQPWREGVKISLPREVLRKWVADTTEILEVSQATKQLTGRKIEDPGLFKLWISAVAYSNYDGIDHKKDEELLRCGNQINSNLRNVPRRSELTGYIKDMAWSYEKEVRIKTKFANWMGFDRTAITMPDYVIDSLIITPSPLFEGDLTKRIEDEVNCVVNSGKSKFKGRLRIGTACDKCSILHP